LAAFADKTAYGIIPIAFIISIPIHQNDFLIRRAFVNAVGPVVLEQNPGFNITIVTAILGVPGNPGSGILHIVIVFVRRNEFAVIIQIHVPAKLKLF